MITELLMHPCLESVNLDCAASLSNIQSNSPFVGLTACAGYCFGPSRTSFTICAFSAPLTRNTTDAPLFSNGRVIVIR